MGRGWMCCAVALSLSGCQSGEEPVRGANKGVEPAATYHPAKATNELVDTPIPSAERAARDRGAAGAGAAA